MTAQNADVDTLRRLIFGRATCRAYLSDPVPEDVIRSIADVARGTASWCNTQPWDLVVTSGESTGRFRDALMEQARQHPALDSDFPFPEEYRGVYLDRRRRSGLQLYEALGIARGDKERRNAQSFENFRLFGAPHVAIVTTDEALGEYGAMHRGRYVANFLLAAPANGAATVAQASLAMYPEVLREELGIGADRRVVCGISFGYADTAHPANSYRTNRAAQSETVTWVGE